MNANKIAMKKVPLLPLMLSLAGPTSEALSSKKADTTFYRKS